MKRKSFLFFTILIAAVLTVFISCNNILTPEKITVNENIEVGAATVGLVIPDYSAMARGRAVAPQTASIRFSYYKSSTSAWVTHQTVNLSDSEKVDIAGLPVDFPYSVIKVRFERIPSGTYSTGTMKVELLDSSGNVITSGKNNEVVYIEMGETTQTSFYTVPDNASYDQSDLNAGEMKFYKMSVLSGKTYSIEVTVGNTDTVYPDIVVFDAKGSFVKYYSVNSAGDVITFDEETKNTKRYIGIYNDENSSISSYSLNITSTGTITGGVDHSEFNSEGFGSDSTFGDGWISIGRGAPVLTSDGYVYFNYKTSGGACTGSLSRSIIFSENTLITFSVKTDIYSTYDGYLNFYIDGVLQNKFTGTNGSWTEYQFLIPEGEHTIKWAAEDPTSNYTSGITNSVYLKNISITTAPDPDYTLQNGFGLSDAESFTYDWTVAGTSRPVLSNGIVTFDFKYKETGSLSRTIYAENDAVVKFSFGADISSDYDGYLDFYIDDVLQDQFTGKNGSWTLTQYYVPTGYHTIRWEINDTSSYQSSGTHLVMLKEISLGDAPDPDYTLQNGFGLSDAESFTYDWTVAGSSRPVLLNGIVYFDFKYKETGSLSRTIYVENDSVVKFSYGTDISSDYDGYLDFYIDDVLQDQFTGENSNVTGTQYYVSAGYHTIRWEINDTSSSQSSGTHLVMLKEISLEDAPAPDYTLQNGFGAADAESFTYDWTVAGSSKPILLNGIVYFDFKYKETGSLSRTIYAENDSVVKFSYATDIVSSSDGYLDFYIDDVLQDQFTGKNSNVTETQYYVSAGYHTIKWEINDTSSSQSSGPTHLVILKEISLEDAPDPDYTLQNGFGAADAESFAYDWTVAGSSKPILLNGIVYFDFKYKETGSLSRTVYAENDSLLRFSYGTDISSDYDGYLDFYIDDVLQDKFTGKNGSVTDTQYSLSAGYHTIRWEINDTVSSQTSGITHLVMLKDIYMIDEPEAPATVSEDFEGLIDTTLWMRKGVYTVITEDALLQKWDQYGDALLDTHGKVLTLATKYSTAYGSSSLKLFKVNPTVDSVISFDYKCDLYTGDYLRVYVDGEKEFETTGHGQMWRNASVPLNAGLHSISFAVEKTSSTYSTTYLNLVHLDNIHVLADTIDSVSIYPKGLQETIVEGSKIQFSAKALRSDGSVIEGKTVTWTSTGGSIDENGLFTPGSTAGTYTVTASVDGKEASNTSVKVYENNYKLNSETIGGVTYTGLVSSSGTSLANTNYVTFEKGTGLPSGKTIRADGFFVIKGRVADGKYAVVKTTKKLSDNNDHYTMQILKGDFCERIWLRFGSGDYEVKIYDADISFNNTGDANYEGALSGSWGSSYNTEYNDTNRILTVTNTATTSIEKAMWTMPSYYCQADDFTVSNAVNALLAELPEDATDGQKLQIMHDWLVHRNHYDYVSFNHSTKRKKQDAVSVINYEMAVCEGYANALIAMYRRAGFEAKYINSDPMNHGWLNVKYKEEWKLIDATWDDPSESNSDSSCEKNPYSENYKYFLIDLGGVNSDHYSYSDDAQLYNYSARSASSTYSRNRLPGWY